MLQLLLTFSAEWCDPSILKASLQDVEAIENFLGLDEEREVMIISEENDMGQVGKLPEYNVLTPSPLTYWLKSSNIRLLGI